MMIMTDIFSDGFVYVVYDVLHIFFACVCM